MEERENKTIICSVLFLDIVEYSQKNVAGQISLKEGFNVFLSTALSEIPVEDRIILDTGDGAAISFLGDIEDALKVALSMRHSLMTAGVYMDTPLLVRMGINLGPVRLVKDINNQPNIVGDGINVAQRIMGFADAGQLLVSRSYYDAVSRISQEYAGMFHYQGSRTDKHVREHQIYAIGYPGEFTVSQKRIILIGNKVSGVYKGLRRGAGRRVKSILQSFQKANTTGKALYVAVTLLILVIAGAGFAWKQSSQSVVKKQVVRYYPDADRDTSLTVGAAVPVTEGQIDKQSEPIRKPETSSREAVKVETSGKQSKPSIARVRTLEETTGKAAVMNLVILPWGEVYLDGRMQGISPPLLELQVAPGKHEIEIRNGSFPAYRQTIQAKVGERIKISHRFSN